MEPVRVLDEHQSFGRFEPTETQMQELNTIYDSRREADWDYIDRDIEYQQRELKRLGGNIDENRIQK